MSGKLDEERINALIVRGETALVEGNCGSAQQAFEDAQEISGRAYGNWRPLLNFGIATSLQMATAVGHDPAFDLFMRLLEVFRMAEACAEFEYSATTDVDYLRKQIFDAGLQITIACENQNDLLRANNVLTRMLEINVENIGLPETNLELHLDAMVLARKQRYGAGSEHSLLAQFALHKYRKDRDWHPEHFFGQLQLANLTESILFALAWRSEAGHYYEPCEQCHVPFDDARMPFATLELMSRQMLENYAIHYGYDSIELARAYADLAKKESWNLDSKRLLTDAYDEMHKHFPDETDLEMNNLLSIICRSTEDPKIMTATERALEHQIRLLGWDNDRTRETAGAVAAQLAFAGRLTESADTYESLWIAQSNRPDYNRPYIADRYAEVLAKLGRESEASEIRQHGHQPH